MSKNLSKNLIDLFYLFAERFFPIIRSANIVEKIIELSKYFKNIRIHKKSLFNNVSDLHDTSNDH